MANALTAASVSRFLGTKGFTRSRALPSRVRGYRRYTDGYQVRTEQGVVVVELVGLEGERLTQGLENLAETLRERWTVTLDQRGMSSDSRYLKLSA